MALQDFIDTFSRYGIGKKYNFQVTDIINAPTKNRIGNALKEQVGGYNSRLLYVESFTLPSIKVNTATVPYKAFDLNVPTNVTFPDANRWRVTFFSDDSLLIRTLFENWSALIYDPATNHSDSSLYDKDKFGLCNLEIQINDDTDKYVKKYTLYGVFPTLVEGIEYNVGDPGETAARLPVTLTFQYFSSN